MRREAISFVLAMTVTTYAAALSAPTLVASKGGAMQMRMQKGYIGPKTPAPRTDFEPRKDRQH